MSHVASPPAGDVLPVPYCGTPPEPAELLLRWNPEPWLPLVLAVAAATFVFASRAGAGGGGARRRVNGIAFHGGLALLAVAFVSPLCALAVALFSARVVQHLLVLFVAAPLLVGGARLVAGAHAARPRGAVPLGLAFGAVFAVWHLPAWYEATFTSDAAFFAMHGSTLALALAFWHAALPDARTPPSLAAPVAAAAVALPMGTLGALLTFAPRALYAPHAVATAPYGLSALEDQQLGGLLMWVPGGAALLAVAVVAAAQLAGRSAEPPSSARST